MTRPSIKIDHRPPRPGRPRSEEAHDAILQAVIALVREVGYDAVTMEGIAVRAGAGKATLYRRWPGKELLVAEAIGRLISSFPVPDTGGSRGDPRAVMRATVGMYRDPATRALLSGLVAAMARSDVIARAVRDGFVAARRETMRRVLRRWRARGDLREDVDIELALDMLNGPRFYRFLVTVAPVDERLAAAVIEVVLRGIAAGVAD